MSILWDNQGKVKKITVDWANIDADTVDAGTPMGNDGQVHNDAEAIGMLMNRITKPWDGTCDVLVAGFVDVAEVAVELADAAINAMHGIRFVEDGVILPLPIESSSLPKASADALGAVKVGETMTVDENGVINNYSAVAG